MKWDYATRHEDRKQNQRKETSVRARSPSRFHRNLRSRTSEVLIRSERLALPDVPRWSK